MRLIGNLIVRLIVVFIGLMLALFAASLFLAIGLVTGLFPELFADGVETLVENPSEGRSIAAAIAFALSFISSLQLAGLALLPVTIAIAAAEAMRWQGMITHLVLGGLVALFAMFTHLQLPEGKMPADGTVIVTLATGFVGAFFYWLIAGRGSGNWLPRSTQEDISHAP